jgi:hypothetical protein
LDREQVWGEGLHDRAGDAVHRRIVERFGQVAVGVILDDPPDGDPIDRFFDDAVLSEAWPNTSAQQSDVMPSFGQG